jgi:hypothetical protein
VEASFQNSIERDTIMHEPDFWTGYADSMELTIEGNRLIAREIADLVRDFWTRLVRSLDELLHGSRGHRHLPPT